MLLPFMVMAITACSKSETLELNSPAHRDAVHATYAEIVQENGPRVIQLTFKDALDLAAKSNLDARVSALEILVAQNDLSLEKLSAMPEFQLIHRYTDRSNPGASSSRSVISGDESLEPSVSTDTNRHLTDLDLRWGYIDVLLAASRSRNASDNQAIAIERHRKVKHNIYRDTARAFWRAYTAQQFEPDIRVWLDKAQGQLANIAKAKDQKLMAPAQISQQEEALLQEVQVLRQDLHEIRQTREELKTLLGLPLDTKVSLEGGGSIAMDKILGDLIATDIKHFELEALKERPEVREAFLSENIALRNIRQEIIQTFPGAEIFLGLNRDTNSFLENKMWGEFSLSIAQNLSRLFTLPVRYRAAENRRDLEAVRRLALSAAVITQVHLARQRLVFSHEIYEEAASLEQAKTDRANIQAGKQSEGFVSGGDVLRSRLQEFSAKVRSGLAKADLIESLASFYVTLGRDQFDVGGGQT